MPSELLGHRNTYKSPAPAGFFKVLLLLGVERNSVSALRIKQQPAWDNRLSLAFFVRRHCRLTKHGASTRFSFLNNNSFVTKPPTPLWLILVGNDILVEIRRWKKMKIEIRTDIIAKKLIGHNKLRNIWWRKVLFTINIRI